MLVLSTTTSLATELSDSLLTYSLARAYHLAVGVCYELSLFDNVSRRSASLLNQSVYAAHVRDALKVEAAGLGSTAPIDGANFSPPVNVCCGRHSLQAWGVLRKTPQFKWAMSEGMHYLCDFIEDCILEVEYRTSSVLPIKYKKASVLLRGYAQMTNHPYTPTWFAAPCVPSIVSSFFADRIAHARSLGIEPSLDRLSPDSVVALSQHLVRQLPDGWLVYNRTRPPSYLGAGRQWFCVPTSKGKAMYYPKSNCLPTWEFPTYWTTNFMCASMLDDLTV